MANDSEKYCLIHMFKFIAYKKSMMLRNYLDVAVVFVLTVLFLVYIIEFNKFLAKSIEDLHRLSVYQ